MLLLTASFVIWLSIELTDYLENKDSPDHIQTEDNIKTDDVNKINSILKIVDKNQFYILKNRAIQTYMEDDDYSGLLNLMHYKESDIFPFHNERIQTTYEKFCSECQNFYFSFYNLYTSDGRGRSTWRPLGDRYVNDEIYEGIMAKIAELDRMALSLAELWEQLIAVARQELKGASKSIEHYDT
jgi:hypothetical protein